MNKFFGLQSENDIYIDGYLLDHPKYKIAIKGIVALELVLPNKENKLKNSVVNVWTLIKEER